MLRSKAHHTETAVHRLTIAGFVLAICIPCMAQIAGYNPEVPLQEGENLPLPGLSFDLQTLGQTVYSLRRNWLDRNFGIRKTLVRWQALLDVRFFGASMPSDPVLAGKNGWLYLAQENPSLNVISDYRVIAPLTPEQLAVWVKVFTSRRDWLAARGIRYMVVVAPNKASIYPEHIPERFNKARDVSKLDQLCSALANADVDVLDLRPALMEAKTNGKAYYSTDSHWTPFGAFFAYRATADQLKRHFPSLEPLPGTDFAFSERPGLKGGLSYMIALGDIYGENEVMVTPKRPLKAREESGVRAELNHFQPLSTYSQADTSLPKAVVFRDSFLHEMMPFLAEHFSRIHLVWPYPTSSNKIRDFDRDAILREKPDIVIDEFVERYFTQPPPPSALETLPPAP
ncbi:putative alginate O-acetylase AlgJ [Fundidesulfovibrio magnetotacticus]|uniref:Putative alginate O-acetylase AlgJ n=1 Tax=Fundidesulfovibrio magnetotacticus TaxID=2730080 RepID=A0A6V8LU48_9BACT|nr:hypothetical protein [Fundidesulfovibrio magnetotacticus]GFK95244.1 putative alginate O-acetylase AlgJ [Fundidesulfovibrio magnetotacticus]